MTTSTEQRFTDDSGEQWYWIAVIAGITSLLCYFLSPVLAVFPRGIDRILFYSFGPTLAMATYAVGYLLREQGRPRPLFQLGVLFTCVAGIAVNMMAVIQDSAYTMMGRRIAEAELEATKDTLRQVLYGLNWVQLSFDIVFDIWISGGCVLFALGMLVYMRRRVFGVLGVIVGAGALAVNFATLPTPPADAGLFDPGPFVATWFGFFLAFIMVWHRRGRLPGGRLS